MRFLACALLRTIDLFPASDFDLAQQPGWFKIILKDVTNGKEQLPTDSRRSEFRQMDE